MQTTTSNEALARPAVHRLRMKLVQNFMTVRTKLVRTLNRKLHNHEDARDAVQDTFLKCWRSVGRVPHIRDMQAWIFRVGLNAANDIQRSAWRRKARQLIGATHCQDTRTLAPDAAAEEREDVQRLQKAVSALRPNEQNVFQLRRTGRMTHEEIARVLQSPVGTVKTRFRASISKLREAMNRKASSAE